MPRHFNYHVWCSITAIGSCNPHWRCVIRTGVVTYDFFPFIGGIGRHLDKMKALVSRLGLERNITLLGFVPDDRLNNLYNQSQCVVVPSVFEGFGLTVIEAIATGTRVVGTDVDGIRSTLKSGDYGTLVPYGDCKALAAALVAELKNPRNAQELGPEYRIEQFRDSYLELLEGS